MCYNGKPHDLENIYKVSIGWNEERVVQWCTKCGAVCIAKASDGRIFDYIGEMRFPDSMFGLSGAKD